MEVNLKMDKDKKFKIFDKNVGNSGRLYREYIIEAQNPLQNFLNEEETAMKDERLVVNQFKKLVRKSLYNFSVDLYRHRVKLQKREILTDENLIVDNEVYDDYDSLGNYVVVLDFKMTVKNDLLYEVLNSMEQHQRDIIYLSLCEDMSDKEIGNKLKMSRSKVQRIKQKLKNEIYNTMTGGLKND